MQTVKIFRVVWVCMSIVLLISHLSYGEAKLEMRHDPPECAVTGTLIGISADILSPTSLKEARVYFKASGTRSFYFVQMKHEQRQTYTGIIPASVGAVPAIEYLVLVVDGEKNVLRSPVFSVSIRKPSECPGYQYTHELGTIVVQAEEPMRSGIGFVGENIQWNVSQYRGESYLRNAREIQVRSSAGTVTTQKKQEGVDLKKTGKTLGLTSKVAIGVGAGLGAIALIAATRGEDEPDIAAELVKVPDVQTTCGTIVTNELYVTNRRSEVLAIGNIDYEVTLTVDQPPGSCGSGRKGTFTPNLAAQVQPGEKALIRRWSNLVNPCNACPYVISECRWDSKYIVHTEVRDVEAVSSFTVTGDLCAIPTAKWLHDGTQIEGDINP